MKITRQALQTALRRLKSDAKKEGVTLYLRHGVASFTGSWLTFGTFKNFAVHATMTLADDKLEVRLNFRGVQLWYWCKDFVTKKILVQNTGLDIVDAK